METDIIFKQMARFKHKIWKQIGEGKNPPFKTPVVFAKIVFFRLHFDCQRGFRTNRIRCGLFTSAVFLCLLRLVLRITLGIQICLYLRIIFDWEWLIQWIPCLISDITLTVCWLVLTRSKRISNYGQFSLCLMRTLWAII